MNSDIERNYNSAEATILFFMAKILSSARHFFIQRPLLEMNYSRSKVNSIHFILTSPEPLLYREMRHGGLQGRHVMKQYFRIPTST